MAKSHPIKSQEHRDLFAEALMTENPMLADLWDFGTLTSFRISDILTLRVSTDWDKHFNRGFIQTKDKKTSKSNHTKITPKLREIIERRITKAQSYGSDYLFFSTDNRGTDDAAISDRHVRRLFGKIAKACGIPANVGTHSMRKTAGYVMYSNGVPLERIQKRLNHSSPAETLAYIGIEQEQLDADLEDLESWL